MAISLGDKILKECALKDKKINKNIIEITLGDKLIRPLDYPLCDGFTRLNKYLYKVDYTQDDVFDYANAQRYFNEHYKPTYISSMCTSCRVNNIFARNLDWLYDNEVQVVELTAGIDGERYASIAVSDSNPKLTTETICQDCSDEEYDILPFKVVDGINENGVYVSVNVVPGNEEGWIPTTGTNPEGEDLCMIMLPRFVLDNCASASEAITKLIDKNIYAPVSESLSGFEFHYMIGDSLGTYVIEFVNNEMVIFYPEYLDPTKDSLPSVITNFRLDGCSLDSQGHIDYDTVSEYGSGLERYDTIIDKLPNIVTKYDVLDLLLSDLKLTNAYPLSHTPIWYSEFVGGDLKVSDIKSNPDKFNDIRLLKEYDYNNRVRGDGKTRQTNHTSVYDINNKNLILCNQENKNDIYNFRMPTNE